MWQANFLIIVYTTLGSLCLAMVPKANITSETSNTATYFGRIVIGSGKELILNKNKVVSNGPNQPVPENTEGYQSDQPASTAWHGMLASKLKQLNPTVYCGGDAMTLHVQGSTMPNLMIDGGDDPVPLDQMPATCGLSVIQGPTDAAFTVHYQGCHVIQQGDGHVLPLSLWGMPIKISCPLAPYAFANVSCLASGMVTKISYRPADDLKLKVNSKWHPFITASGTCGFTMQSETDGLVVHAPYQSGCWQIKGGEKFLSLLYGNEELTLSCPDSQNLHPYGHVRIVTSQSHEPSVTPAGTPTAAPTTPAEPTETATSSVASDPQQPAYPFNHMYHPYGPMLHHHKPMHHRYPWAFPAKAPTTAPTTATTSQTTATSSVASDPQQPAYPFNQMYYPYGPMLHNHKPMHHKYPWAFPAKAPTTAPTTTAPTTSTTFQTTATSSVSSDPQQPAYPFNQMYHPYGPMLHHHKPMHHKYPWAFPAKAPTTAPTTATTSQTTATSSVASDPQQPAYPFNQMYYPYGPMLHHHKPMHHRYPWAFPAKAPTTAPTTATTTHTTATSSVASDPQQPAYPFNQMYYPYGPMLHHHKPMHHRYHWAFPAKVPAPTTTTATTSQTTATSSASDPHQPAYPFNHIYYPYGPTSHHHKPMPYGYPWAFPATAPTTAPTTQSATTTLISDANDPQSVYLFNQVHHPFGPIHCHHAPMALAATPAYQPAYPFNPVHQFGPMSSNRKPMPYGYPLAFPA